MLGCNKTRVNDVNRTFVFDSSRFEKDKTTGTLRLARDNKSMIDLTSAQESRFVVGEIYLVSTGAMNFISATTSSSLT
jgi:hypothetical protein